MTALHATLNSIIMPAAKKKTVKVPTPLEKDFHAAAMAYLNMALPSHAVATTFPAGGGGKIRGAQLKRSGLLPGWPDIQILMRASSFDQAAKSFSRFIGFECKRQGAGVVSEKQITAHERIATAGGVVYVVRTLDEIYQHLIAESINLRCKPGV